MAQQLFTIDPAGSNSGNEVRGPATLGRIVDGDCEQVLDVFFAGEALNPKYPSTVHAAHESGLANAKAVIECAHERIAVVGAGMSGLTAAHMLAEHGCTVTVFEARDRIDEVAVAVERAAVGVELEQAVRAQCHRTAREIR